MDGGRDSGEGQGGVDILIEDQDSFGLNPKTNNLPIVQSIHPC